MTVRHGGDIVGEVLRRRGVSHVFTLCGGHISPILVGAKERGIAIVDVRDEASAIFAADAVARLTGRCGVAAVTAGPGVTNAITAIKNAELAQTPLLVLGGATATILKGRGALQDIDQLALVRSATKHATAVSTVKAIAPALDHAIDLACSGVPGPVFVEIPVDLLDPEAMVREWYLKESGVERGGSLGARALELYLKAHLQKQFHLPHLSRPDVRLPRAKLSIGRTEEAQIAHAAALLRGAERPVLVIGNQTMVSRSETASLASAVLSLGVPTWLAGSARGLLGRFAPTQFRHARSAALREADLVIVAGFPFDFRLKYGRGLARGVKVVAANLDRDELRKNRRPDVGVRMHPADFLERLAGSPVGSSARFEGWLSSCREREDARDREIAAQARTDGELVDPIHFFLRMEEKLGERSVLIADGGDFVATAAYILRPRSPLSWLDPGLFGTLGVGGGFAVGAAALRRDAEVWIVWGDGSCAYSIAELDTCARHGLAPIAIVGTDASWAQIARDQIDILGDDVATRLARTAYHTVAEGYGAVGLLLDDPAKVDDTLDRAKEIARGGRPVLVNVQIAKTDFRKGSISI